MCNCDSGHDTFDDGLNTYQQLLPITQLYVGGTTTQKTTANITISSLKCAKRRNFLKNLYIKKF